MCSTVKFSWHEIQTGGSSPASKYLCVVYVWPNRSLQRTSCSLRRSLFDSDPHPNVGCTEWSLLLIWVAHKSDHLPLMNSFIKGLKSEYGNVMIVCLSFSAAFAAVSANSFPCIPTWLGTQQNNTVLFTSAEHFSNTSKTKGWSMCWCSIAWRHDKESTQITYLSLLELFTTSRASRIAHSSAVYMDACPGKRLLTILQFETTAHPTLWSSFEPSVYRNWWSKYLSWTSLKSPWKWWCFRPLLCTLFRLNWAKQTPGIMRRN